MDKEKLKNKAKPMKKRSVRLVHEHFEEVFVVPLILNKIEGKPSYLFSPYSCCDLSSI